MSIYTVEQIESFYNTRPPEEREFFERTIFSDELREIMGPDQIKMGGIARFMSIANAVGQDGKSLHEAWDYTMDRTTIVSEAMDDMLATVIRLLTNEYAKEGAIMLKNAGVNSFDPQDFKYQKSPAGKAIYHWFDYIIELDISSQTLHISGVI